MEFSSIRLLLTSLVLSMSYGDDCCDRGISRATRAVYDVRFDCTPSETFANHLDGLQRTKCRETFRTCCEGSARGDLCKNGILFSRNNKLCVKGYHYKLFGHTQQNYHYKLFGDTQQKCCECCFNGKKAGQQREDCDKDQDNEFCTYAFKHCCQEVEKKMTKTEKPILETCADIKCNLTASQGCRKVHSEAPFCICKDGYQHKHDKMYCYDIDECMTKPNPCPGRQCTNTLGSFTCSCEEDYKWINTTCIHKDNIQRCDQGYVKSKENKCEDKNECVLGIDQCSVNMFCLNTVGSYQCIEKCLTPRFKNASIKSKQICEDIDECSTGQHHCDLDIQKCVNLIGTYNCDFIHCEHGYKLEDNFCADVDECFLNDQLCGIHGHCINTNGSYHCDCQRGFKLNEDTQQCEDIDECVEKRDDCVYKCVNDPGTYHCLCPEGYLLFDQRICEDIDECIKKPCRPNHRCFNTYGSYACINESCPNKYYKRTPQLKQPDFCRKNCVAKWNDTKNPCYQLREMSIKRAVFKYQKVIDFQKFIFNSNIHFHPRYYETETKLISGNKRREFELKKIAEGISIVNSKRIRGNRRIHLIMRTDIRRKNPKKNKLVSRYVYHIYIFVSRYKMW